MRVSRNTMNRVESVKSDLAQLEQQLDTLIARIREHPGVKKKADKLLMIKAKLETWRTEN